MPSTHLPIRIVLIDDEEWLLDMVEAAIRQKFKDIDLRAFKDSEMGWKELSRIDPDILITGAQMGELSGDEIVRRLIRQKAPYPILVMSGWPPAEEWVKTFANEKPNISFLPKPFTTEQLYRELSKLLVRDDTPVSKIIALCPRCGLEVLEGSTGYFCRGRSCGFRVSKVILGKDLNVAQATKLLQNKRTDLLFGFVSKSGRPFSAWLVMDDSGKVTFEFPTSEPIEGTEREKQSHVEKHRSGEECKPLLEAATKDLFLKNAFRITGLPVDATPREISKHAAKIKMLAELGQNLHSEAVAFPMKSPPTLDDIRDALQKLNEPEKRIIDELFWFWPEEFGCSQTDPAIQAFSRGDSEAAAEIWAKREKDPTNGVVAKHNLALVYHVGALDWENVALGDDVTEDRRNKITTYWKGAFARWEDIAVSEPFWEKVTTRIRQLAEPNLKPDFAQQMRNSLPEALDKVNAELAVAFAESGKIELARLHIKFMRETNRGLDNIEKTAELVLTPSKNRLKDQIRRAEERGKINPREGADAARELLKHAHHTVILFDLFFGAENDLKSDLFDEVAGVCNRLQVSYHNATDDDKICLEILNSALPLTTAIELRQQIEKNITALKGFAANKAFEPIYQVLKAIQDSKEFPSMRLSWLQREIIPKVADIRKSVVAPMPPEHQALLDSVAIVLRGISLDAWNSRQDRQTAVTANTLAMVYVISSELKQKLEEDKTTLHQLVNQMAAAAAAKRESAKRNGIGCLAIIAIVIVLAVIGSCNSTTPSSSNYSGTAPTAESTPTYTQPPVSDNGTAPTSDNGNSSGNVNSVPNTASRELAREKAQIEADRSSLESLDAQVEALGKEIDNDRLVLDQYSQAAVDDFNEKVNQYNALLQQEKTATAAFNEEVDTYNAKLRQ